MIFIGEPQWAVAGGQWSVAGGQWKAFFGRHGEQRGYGCCTDCRDFAAKMVRCRVSSICS